MCPNSMSLPPGSPNSRSLPPRNSSFDNKCPNDSSFDNKSLYICFTGCPQGFAIRSLPVNTLFNHHHHHQKPPPPLKEVWSYLEDGAVAMMECCGKLDSKVCFVGTVHHNPLPPGGFSGKFVVVYDMADDSVSFLPDMISRKSVPIVFAVDKSIYVLADPSDGTEIADTPFEVCNLSTETKKWEKLPQPPFFDPHSNYWDIGTENFAYVVIGTSICVSTFEASFKFNLDKNIWEPCTLFQQSSPTPTTLDCGPPFHFRGRAILFGDDTLICAHYRSGVVAYKMVGGKVVKSQSLDIHAPACTSCIAHVGDCFFCMFDMKYIGQTTYLYTVTLFRLIKKEDKDDPEEFLLCEIVNEFNYEHEFGNSTTWDPIYCFVQ